MTIARRLRCITAAAGVSLLFLISACAGAASSSDYPERTIQLIFPFAAGSPGDVSARALSAQAEKVLGQEIEVVNRPGAAGTVGVTEVLNARPDGYTVGFVPIAPMTVQPQRSDLAYEGTDGYRPVIMISKQPEVLFVPASSPWQTFEDFVAAAKAGEVTVATSGRGTILDIDTQLLAKQAGLQLSTVSFEGEQQVIAATLGGTTQASVSGATSALPFAESGKMRVLAVFTDEPVGVFPQVPTVKSKGYEITFGVDNFVIVPKDTPDRVVQVLHDTFKTAMESQEYQKFLEDNGYVAQYMGPDGLARFLDEQYQKYGKVIADLGLAGT